MHKGGFSPLFYEGVPEQGKDIFRGRLKTRFAHLDEHLSRSEYLMGRDYSVADAQFFVVSNWASWVKFDLSPIWKCRFFSRAHRWTYRGTRRIGGRGSNSLAQLTAVINRDVRFGVKSRHQRMYACCPLYRQKRTAVE
jgi:glutathione S-transferase